MARTLPVMFGDNVQILNKAFNRNKENRDKERK
jgi:hypothetical protein